MAGQGIGRTMEGSIKAAVCDDERSVHGVVRRLLEKYAEKHGIILELHHIYSAQELLAFEKEIDFLLLDIDMPKMDGIEAARVLNARGISYKIVMLTSKAERFKEAFQIGAFRFVTKPIFADELYEAVDEVRERMTGMGEIQACRDNVSYKIVQRDILYLMADSNTVRIFTKQEEYRSEKPLKAWMEELDLRMFFACHRSYIVNLGKIADIGSDMAILVSGEKVPVARRKRTGLQQAYRVYDTRRR